MAEGAAEPNINFGSPCIFYDSHPELQSSWLGGYWQGLKSHLYIAWSGDVPKRLFPGTLRLVWWTTDNTEGLRDYELHQHALVKLQYDSLCDVPDVNRCLIMGYSGQNPYVMTYGHNIWQEKFKKERRSNNAKWLSEEERSKRRAEREKRLEAEGAGEDAIGEERERERERVRKARIGVKVDEIIMSNEESETQRLLGDVDPDDMA